MTSLAVSSDHGVVKTPDIAPDYGMTDIGVLPKDWDVVEIGTLNPFVTSGSRGWARFYSDAGSPFIRITNLSREEIDLELDEVRFVDLPTEAMVEASRTHLEEGDILISITADIGIIGYVDSSLPLPAYMNQHIALIRFDPTKVCGRYVAYSLASERPQKLFLASMDVGAKAGMSLITVRKIRFPLPPFAEQRSIAAALSDVDELIGALDKLIAKKRAIKLATMQQLLTGKTRLPGFRGEWRTLALGEGITLASGHHVLAQHCNMAGEGLPYLTGPADFPNGEIILTKYTTKAGTLCDVGDILVTVKGSGAGTLVVADASYCISRQLMAIKVHKWDPQFIFYSLLQNAGKLQAASTGLIPGLSRSDILGQELPLPLDRNEQTTIATVLSDMDAEITALEQRRDKTKAIKQGMMQQLLTGRIRLVEPEVTRLDADSGLSKGHNWAFNEAVVIATLAKQFGSEEYPLGRKRYTKLSYLLHRHAEKQPEGYLKKAAGPYNPKTKYGGPEKIALQKGYVREQRSGRYKGFVAAEANSEAQRYFEKWYGSDATKWLNQFRFMKNDHLEVLATVDMAVEELRTAGKNVTVACVKDVIRSHPEWEAKLDRPVFCDTEIEKAIESSRKLFGRGDCV